MVAGQADIDWSNQLGCYEGFHLLLAMTSTGVITGFGSASTHDQQLAEIFFALRASTSPQLHSTGLPATGSYVADKGFAGAKPHRRWHEQYQVEVITPPHQTSQRERWPKALRRWLADLRQIIETVNDKLLNTLRLARERPHALDGFQARLAAKVGLHNFCIWLNGILERTPLAFADLIDWSIPFPISHHEMLPTASAILPGVFEVLGRASVKQVHVFGVIIPKLLVQTIIKAFRV
jgi:hypothetical protein